jgi:serine protease Do
MRIPDWVVYAVVLAVIVGTLFSSGSDDTDPFRVPDEVADARVAPPPGVSIPRPPSREGDIGPTLPEAHPFDERVLVQVGDAEDGIGTAFAINQAGAWLTARHVVDGCTRVGLAVGNGRMVRVDEVRTSDNSDLALLITDRAPVALQLDLDRDLRVGEPGFHVGYPQGMSGEAASVLESRSNLVTRGRYQMEEPVLAWAEQGRTDVVDRDGAVVGVTVAESPRRGRIYSASPDSIRRFLDDQGLVAPGGDARPISSSSYAAEADRLRDSRAVVKVLCRVNNN